MAINLLLNSFIDNEQLCDYNAVDWGKLSKLFSSRSSTECHSLFKEIESHTSKTISTNCIPNSNHNGNVDASLRNDVNSSCSQSDVPSSIYKHKCESNVKFSNDQSPVMVIHVCDEAKNLKQDFQCSRNLLVNEMKYFAEYLMTDAQRWEDVDISVHCDVQIFDWLMKYAKRNTVDVSSWPGLEACNVISILISSDFLKMDSLVELCVKYCHEHMNAIIATPCNMNCINEKLIGKIAKCFSHNEADGIKDKKDKFKSKIFIKKIEQLFEPKCSNKDGSTDRLIMYKCSMCQKILTKLIENDIPCIESRIVINRKGGLSYNHVLETSWDINDYIIELKNQSKSWQNVYWRILGTINTLSCARCLETFQCINLGKCRYHPGVIECQLVANDDNKSYCGMYTCCNELVLKYDPLNYNTGCKIKDHVFDSEIEVVNDGNQDNNSLKLYNDLLIHRDLISSEKESFSSYDLNEKSLNLFVKDESYSKCKKFSSGVNVSKSDCISSVEWIKSCENRQPRLQPLTIEKEVKLDLDLDYGDEEDEDGDDEEIKMKGNKVLRKSRITVDPQAILVDAPDFSSISKSRKWDSARSLRWNQDSQREEDERKMAEIGSYLTNLRLDHEKLDKVKKKEYAGGLYSKFEVHWKMFHYPPLKISGQIARAKTRLTSLRM